VIETIIKKIFGDIDTKKLKQYQKDLEKIKKVEETLKDYSGADIQKRTSELQARFKGLDFKDPEGSKKIIQILEEIKYEAFALVRQATRILDGQEFELSGGKKIVWNMVPYDVQLIGGLAIHEGNISEMKTGE